MSPIQLVNMFVATMEPTPRKPASNFYSVLLLPATYVAMEIVILNSRC